VGGVLADSGLDLIGDLVELHLSNLANGLEVVLGLARSEEGVLFEEPPRSVVLGSSGRVGFLLLEEVVKLRHNSLLDVDGPVGGSWSDSELIDLLVSDNNDESLSQNLSHLLGNINFTFLAGAG
jgi:hypothetical protein